LVKELQNITILAKEDIMASFYGQGNFALQPAMKKICGRNLAVWVNLTPEGQDGLFNKFTKGLPKFPTEMVSSNGNYAMDFTAGSKKKPNQITRSRVNRAPAKRGTGRPRGRPKKTEAVKRKATSQQPDCEDEPFNALLGFQNYAKKSGMEQ
jgi:hypothetical protein